MIRSPILSCGTIGAAEAVRRARAGELQLVDATWLLPGESAVNGTLPGTTAVLDTDAIKAVPVNDRTPDVLASLFESSGVGPTPQIALYDRAGLFSSAWAWWMLLEVGYTSLVVQGWTQDGDEAPETAPATLPPRYPHATSATLAEVVAALGTDTEFIDARAPGRFAGIDPEPREGLRSGHIPGAVNMPMGRIKNADRFVTPAETFTLTQDLGIDLAKPIITYCGSGVTASALAFVLSRAGATDVRVYMGSWAEYGATDHPVETGL